ncbi:glycoside hydrolase family 6 protein [Streptomyces hirsutus]
MDAYLWVKRPGESDGECKGGPKAGEWWEDYAVKLAEASD